MHKLFFISNSLRSATRYAPAFLRVVRSKIWIVRLNLQLVHNVGGGFVHRLKIGPEHAKTPERMRSDVLLCLKGQRFIKYIPVALSM